MHLAAPGAKGHLCWAVDALVVTSTLGDTAGVVTLPGRYVGWLLRVNRRLSGDGGSCFRSGVEFARAFRREGARPLSPSYVSRWENGEILPNASTVRRYEELLERPAGSLQSAAEYLLRLYGMRLPGSITAPPSASPPASLPAVLSAVEDTEDELLEDLLDRVDGGEDLTGSQWEEMTGIIAGRPDLRLRRSGWRTLCERLLSELVVAEGGAWLQRQEAFSRLLEHPRGSRYATATCIELIEDRSSPVFIEPLSLLEITNRPEANRYVLRQLTTPITDRAWYGASLSVIRKLRFGHYQGEELNQLLAGLREVVAAPFLPPGMWPILAEVDRDLRRLGRHLTGHRRGTPPGAGIGPPNQRACTLATSERIALRAQSAMPDGAPVIDEVLARLTDDALNHADPDKRLASTMLIAATPYRRVVARALLAELRNTPSRQLSTLAGPGLRTLSTLGEGGHRPLIRDLLLSSGADQTLQVAAASALPHCAGAYPVAEWRRILDVQRTAWLRRPSRLGESILHGIAYGIGTDGHPDLLRELSGDVQLPVLARNTASWLMNSELPPSGTGYRAR